jgi:hypothetical protein
MDNATLDSLKKHIVSTFMQKYGYCGCADGPNMAMLNSGGEGEDFTVTIKDVSAIEAEEAAHA